MTDATGATAAVPLQRDVPCAQCGYDLRGLTPPGRCPECGFDIVESVRAASAHGLIPPPQRGWLRAMLAGAACTLASFVLSTIAMMLIGDTALTGVGVLAIGSAIAVWALALCGCWAVARLERLEAQRRSRWLVSRSLRATAVTHVALSLCAVWVINDADDWSLPLTLTGMMMVLTFYLRVRQVAVRLGRPELAGQALTIAVLSPTFPLAVARSWSSYFLNMPPIGGWSGFLRFFAFLDSWEDVRESAAFLSWPFLFTICQVAVLVQLLIVLVRARGSASTRSKDDGCRTPPC